MKADWLPLKHYCPARLMLPVIALVGQPNVGKSTLFNALTKTRDALVVNLPGVTRDRQYGEAFYQQQKYIVVDTGGLSGEQQGIDGHIIEQAWMAIEEADMVLFLVDGRQGITPGDERIADQLRKIDKPVLLIVNKTDGIDEQVALGDFYQLGLGQPIAIAASHRRGVTALIEYALVDCLKIDLTQPSGESDDHEAIKVAFIGRPNVGKSTLTNRLLGQQRMVVYDMPGTTRDSVTVPYERHGQHYQLIDTAGVRRRGRVKQTVEKFSVVKALQAIEASHIVVMVIDATEGVTEQDLHILGFALDAGRGLVLAVNKWDGLTEMHKSQVKSNLSRRLDFIEYFVNFHFISALHGTGVGNLFSSIKQAFNNATKEMSTALLTRILEQAVLDHAPPMYKGRRIKLRYAHCGGHLPPSIIIHGRQAESLPESYRRYLINYFRTSLHLKGTPIRVSFRQGDNPFVKRSKKKPQ